ncbi:hypothetical protein ACP4OV_025471 [Aristida adscensionis]
MYSNNSDSIRDALCFFLDEAMGHKIGFLQYPQNYNNLITNNIYGNSLNAINQYCAFFFGRGKISLRHQMGYSMYGSWAPNSLPTLYYVIIPSLGLLKGTPLFPEPA